MKLSTILFAAILLALACEMESQTPVATSSPDLETTVQAMVAAALPTDIPAPTPDIEATVQARVEATTAAIPTITPIPTATPTQPPEPTATPDIQAMISVVLTAIPPTPTTTATPDLHATAVALATLTAPTHTPIPTITATPTPDLHATAVALATLTAPTHTPTTIPTFIPFPAVIPAPARALNIVPPPARAGEVTITMAIPEVSEQFGDFEVQTYGGVPGETQMGFFDHLLVHDGEDPLSPFVAESWRFNDAGNELTLRIRRGIRFNTPGAFGGENFGELTAHDVAWNMNRQNAAVNPSLAAAIGVQLGATFGEARAIDDYTVVAPMVTDIFWGIPISEFDINDTTVRLDSKRAYDQMGARAVQFVPVGSGPFTIGEWKPNDRGEVHAVPAHWMETAHIGKFVVRQMPEITSRMAAMETGEVDLASIDFARLTELKERGLRFIPTMTEKDTVTLSVIWPGNLWTDKNVKTEEALEPWFSPVYEVDFAHLGNPWCDLGKPCQYEDTDNPPGMSDMEQARLVRWALSMAIDREGFVEILQAGLGTPIYLELMGPRFPGWRPDRTVTQSMINVAHEKYSSNLLGSGTDWPEYNVPAAEPNYEWPWKIYTNYSEAERLLDLAGFPRQADGERFEISLNKYRCETGDLCLEQADAVAAGWEDIGVKTRLLTEEYGAVVVPRMRDRTQAWPVVKNCSIETANYPFDWPPPPSDSSFNRPAWGCSFESRFLDYMFVSINGERDKQAREDLHLDMVDYYYYWQLYSGMVQPPRGVAGNPETVQSWNSRSTMSGFWGRPQHIVPVR